jgi:hypothetical protein
MNRQLPIVGGVAGWSWQVAGLEPSWVLRIGRLVQQRADRKGLTLRWRVTAELDEPTWPPPDSTSPSIVTPDCLVVGVQQLSWPQWLRRLALWNRQRPHCQLLVCTWTLPTIWQAISSEVSGGLLIRSPHLMERAIDRVTDSLPPRNIPYSSLLESIPLPWSEP